MKETLLALIFVMVFTQNPLVCFASEKETPLYSPEYIKALYIVNLSQFAIWDSSDIKKFTICTVGNDELDANLNQVIQENNLSAILFIKSMHLTSSFEKCNMVYISSAADFELPQILYKTKQHQIMTVSDTQNFIDRSGGVGLVAVDEAIVMEINNSLLKEKGILLNSELLDIARRVL